MDLAAIERELAGCGCGKGHRFATKTVEIGPGAAGDFGGLLAAAGFPRRLSVTADRHTLDAAGEAVASLERAGFSVGLTAFSDLTCADAAAAERVRADAAAFGAQAFVSVGTGSLNDVCRWNAARAGLPLALFATAPSMDGFASVIAPITQNGFKRSLPAKAPEVVAADTAVLAAAPAELKSAGLGDLLGKYTALADWRVSHLLTGEAYCPRVAALTERSVARAVELAGGDVSSPEYAAALMEALVISGLAMQLWGNSRPASGAEHHLSHFWEMQGALVGLPEVRHGRAVGAAAGIVAGVYGRLAEAGSVTEARKAIDAAELRAVFGPLAEDVIRENTPDPMDDVPPGAAEAHWDEIRAELRRVPAADEIRALLRRAGGADTAAACGISDERAAAALTYGIFVRRRMTVLRLARSLRTN